MEYKSYKNEKVQISSGKLVFVSLQYFAVFLLLIFCFIIMHANLMLESKIITGLSMYPNINANTSIANDKAKSDIAYCTDNVKNITYGDLIIVDTDFSSKDNDIIKRVIAMQGDNVMIKESTKHKREDGTFYYAIYIQYDGKGEFLELEENYITDKSVNDALYNDFYDNSDAHDSLKNFDANKEYITVKEDEIFYLGDGRTVSYDCGDYGSEKTKNVTDEVVYIVERDNTEIFQIIIQALGFKKWK